MTAKLAFMELFFTRSLGSMSYTHGLSTFCVLVFTNGGGIHEIHENKSLEKYALHVYGMYAFLCSYL